MVFYHHLNPFLLTLGPLQIRWYGVMYALNFLFIYWYVQKASKEKQITLNEEQIDHLMLWLTIALIAGARLFDVLFWEFSYYARNPLEILAIWKGGLSFHGGLAAMILVLVILCKKYKLSFFEVADVFIVPLALGQALGRIGNFFNGELYGIPTTLPWGVNFANEVTAAGQFVFRHPNQLYEAGYDLIIFGTLWFLKDKKLSRGSLFAIFLIMYSIFRSLTEFIRAPDVMIGPLTLAQIFNIPLFIFGVWLLAHQKKKK